mgnify:CR=1 FL=1
MKKKILLAVIIVIILISAGGAYAYFATDAFKSNKEMFLSYLFDGLKDEKLEEYIKKQENESYTNKGTIEITSSGEDDELDKDTAQMLNNSKITIEGKIDNAKKLAEQTVTVNLSAGINVPITIRRDGDTIGVRSNLLSNKFIAVRNENLKSLLEKFEIDSNEVPDKIDFDKKRLTKDEIETLKKRYVSILNENLEEKSFNKEKIDGQTVITLNISEEKFSEILVKILETLRDDGIISDKISDTIDKDEFKDNINDMIDEIKDIDSSENSTMCIKVYINSKELKKAEVSLKDQDNKTIGQLEITKDKNEKDLTYAVKANGESEDDEKVSIDFKMQYKNIAELNNVEENMEVTLITKNDEDKTKISLNYTNINTFTTNLEIEGIDNNNATILNDASDEELNDLLMTIYEKIGFLNDEEDKYYTSNDQEDTSDEEEYTNDDDDYTTDEEKYNIDYRNSSPANQ